MVVHSTSLRGHVVALTLPAWGHAKPTCALLAKIVRFKQVEATLFAPLYLLDKLKREAASNFRPAVDDDLKSMIRIVGIESSDNVTDMSVLTENFLEGYKRLCSGLPIKATPSDDAFYPAITPPQLVIMDFFLYDALQGVRRETGNAVPVYALDSTSASAILFICGPENVGGNGDLAAKLQLITANDERTRAAEADKIYHRIKGELVTVPGLPPMYDHEMSPQKPIMNISIADANAYIHRFFLECDGVIMNTTQVLEKEAIDAIQRWLPGRPVICPAPFDYPLVSRENLNDLSVAGDDVSTFLVKALKRHGPHSVIYMSFGSSWWTAEPEKIWAAVDILVERGIPFIFALSSPLAKMPEETEKKARESGLGFISKWLPQTAILRHEACGWFITHCGHNSVMEALTAGVPLICWPLDIDHPINAALVCDVHNLGYELFETRSWHGLKPIYRLGGKTPSGTIDAFRREFKEVLDCAKGEDGGIKRANAQRMRDSFARSWEDDGEAWLEIKRIVDILH